MFDKRAYNKTYDLTHREESRTRKKRWCLVHREEKAEYDKAYRETHREKLRANDRAYNETHRDAKRAYGIIYRKTHRDAIRAYEKAYRDTHRDQMSAYRATRRDKTLAYSRQPEIKKRNYALQLKRNYGLNLEDYESMWEGQGKKCAACGTSEFGRRAPSVHHDHGPGGKVQGILCSNCNMSAGAQGDDPDRLQLVVDFLRRCAR